MITTPEVRSSASIPARGVARRGRVGAGRAWVMSAAAAGGDSLVFRRDPSSQIIVDGLALVGAAAAVVDEQGRLRCANEPFVAGMGRRVTVEGDGPRFVDRRLADQLRLALADRSGPSELPFVAIRGAGDDAPRVLHVLAIRGAAADLCDPGDRLLLLADTGAIEAPPAALLRELFGLTAMEASVAQRLFDGAATTGVAAALGIGEQTVRSHLKSIFAKTGVGRQIDLVRLLAPLRRPLLSRNETMVRSPPNGGGERLMILSRTDAGRS